MSMGECNWGVLFGKVPTGCGCACEGQTFDGCTSPVFFVTDKPVRIDAYNMDNEYIVVKRVQGRHNQEFEKVMGGEACPVTLTSDVTTLTLYESGAYKLDRCFCIDGNEPAGDPYVTWTENCVEAPAPCNNGANKMSNTKDIIFTTDADGCLETLVQTECGKVVATAKTKPTAPMPQIKRNGVVVPVQFDPTTGQACINITDQDLFITGATNSGNEVVITRSDGAEFPVTLTAPETEQNNINADVPPVLDVDAQTFTFTTVSDVAGAAGSLVVDLSDLFATLTSSPHPDIIAGTNISITGNDVDGYTINSVDTDTFATLSGRTITLADGQSITIPDGVELFQDGATEAVPVPLNCVQPTQRFQDASFALSDAPKDMIHRECDFVNLPRLVEDILNPAVTLVNDSREYDLTAFGVPEDACGVEVYVYAAASALNNTGARATFAFILENGYLVQANADAGAGLNGGQSQLATHIRGTTLRLANVNVMGQDDPDWTPTNRLLVRIGGYYLPIHV